MSAPVAGSISWPVGMDSVVDNAVVISGNYSGSSRIQTADHTARDDMKIVTFSSDTKDGHSFISGDKNSCDPNDVTSPVDSEAVSSAVVNVSGTDSTADLSQHYTDLQSNRVTVVSILVLLMQS